MTPPPAVRRRNNQRDSAPSSGSGEERKVTPPPVVAKKKKPPAAPEVQAKIEGKLDLKKLEYTGLIVDARKLGLRPALIPKILNQKGELVYSSQSVSTRELIKMGLVGYAKDVDAASKNQRVTADPYVIPGMNASGEKKTDVVISNRDAQIVHDHRPLYRILEERPGHDRLRLIPWNRNEMKFRTFSNWFFIRDSSSSQWMAKSGIRSYQRFSLESIPSSMTSSIRWE